MRGLPASGKSTFAENWVKEEDDRFRVNKDAIRQMIACVDFDPKIENVVHDLFLQQVRVLLSRGKSVVADNTHLTKKSINELHNLAKSVGNVEVIEKWVPTSYEDCVRRNVCRERQVPLDVIRSMEQIRDPFCDDVVTIYGHSRLTENCYVADKGLPKAIIVDLDGTLALVGDRSPYDTSLCERDTPNEPIIELVKSMYANGYNIVFLTGRESRFEEQTRRFIDSHVCEYPNTLVKNPELRPIKYELLMRETDDRRKDYVVKQETFANKIAPRYNVRFWVDDRPTVCRMVRNSLGLTCLQVDDVEF